MAHRGFSVKHFIHCFIFDAVVLSVWEFFSFGQCQIDLPYTFVVMRRVCKFFIDSEPFLRFWSVGQSLHID